MGCWRFLVHPDDTPVFDENITNLPMGASRACELRIVVKNGAIRWLSVDTTHVPPGEKSSLSHVFGGCRDITERRRAEELLRTREHDFSTLVENSTDIIVRYDTGYHFLYCNPAVERQMVVSPHRLIGKTPLESGIFVKESLLIQTSLQRTLETGGELEVEQTMHTPFGLRHFMTRIIPEHDFDGTIVSLLAISRDITGRKQADEGFREQSRQELEASYEELQKTEAELRLHKAELEIQNEELRQVQHNLEVSSSRYFELYDLAPSGYLTLSGKGLVLNANLTASTMLGVERHRLLKKPVSHYIVPNDQDIFYRCWNEVINTRERKLCQLHLLQTSWPPLLVQVIAVPAPLSEGNEDAVNLMLIDITAGNQAGPGAANGQKGLLRDTPKV